MNELKNNEKFQQSSTRGNIDKKIKNDAITLESYNQFS